MRKLIVRDVLWSYLMFGHLSNYLASNSNQTNLLTYFTKNNSSNFNISESLLNLCLS